MQHFNILSSSCCCCFFFLINLECCWPQGVRILFMMLGDMRLSSWWQIRHQCLLLETVMTDQDTIHKSGACGEGGWHWCMLGQWKTPQSESRRQRDVLNDFISVQTEISSTAEDKWLVTLVWGFTLCDSQYFWRTASHGEAKERVQTCSVKTDTVSIGCSFGSVVPSRSLPRQVGGILRLKWFNLQ